MAAAQTVDDPITVWSFLDLGAGLAEEVFAKQVKLGTALHFDIAVDLRLASETHGLFVLDVGHARNRIRRKWSLEFQPFRERQAVRVFFVSVGHQDTTSSTQTKTMTVEDFVGFLANAVDSLMEIDSRVDRFPPKVGTHGNVDFFLLFDKLNRWHQTLPAPHNGGFIDYPATGAPSARKNQS